MGANSAYFRKIRLRAGKLLWYTRQVRGAEGVFVCLHRPLPARDVRTSLTTTGPEKFCEEAKAQDA
jgi:hypothetical protein